MTLWIFVMSSLFICTTLASHSGYSEYDSPKLGQNSGVHKGSFSSDSRWTASEDERSNYPFGQEGPLTRGTAMDLNDWPESDAVSFSRQIFGGKSAGECFNTGNLSGLPFSCPIVVRSHQCSSIPGGMVEHKGIRPAGIEGGFGGMKN